MTTKTFTVLFHCALFTLVTISNAQFFDYDYSEVFVGDFNGDGKDDFLRLRSGRWADFKNNTADLFLAQDDPGFESFALDSSFDLTPEDIVVYIADFNGDGKADILRHLKGPKAAKQNKTAYLLLANDQEDHFTLHVLPKNLQLDDDLVELYIGDFNGDGKADILKQIKGNSTELTASVLLSTDDKSQLFEAIDVPKEFGFNGDSVNVYVGDFDGDGKDDIFRSGQDELVEIVPANFFLSKGDGSFEKIDLPKKLNLDMEDQHFLIGDFNGDKVDDVLVTASNSTHSQTTLLLSDRQGGFEKIILNQNLYLALDFNEYIIGDFNGDKKEDLLDIGTEPVSEMDVGSTVTLLLSTGKAFQTSQLYELTDYSTFYVGDFDGDKKDDFLQVSYADIEAIHYSNGDGTFAKISNTDDGWKKTSEIPDGSSFFA